MPDKDTSKARPLRLAIVCGGTGGHFYPGLTVAAACNENAGNAVLFVAGHSQSRFLQIASERGIEAIAAPAVGAHRPFAQHPFCIPITILRFKVLIVPIGIPSHIALYCLNAPAFPYCLHTGF